MLEGVIDTGLQEDVELLLHSEGKCVLETQLIHWSFLMLPCIIVAENCQEKHSWHEKGIVTVSPDPSKMRAWVTPWGKPWQERC